jgi:hypothetical protein
MTTKKGTKKPGPKSTPEEEIEAFAYHMSEALKIARTSDSITARFYNSLAEAWSASINDFKCYQDSSLTESAEFIRLALKMEAGRKGGAR